MRRKSSYGYNSYSKRPYHYKSYGKGYGHGYYGNNSKKKIIAVSLVCAAIAAGAVGACAYFGVFGDIMQNSVSENSLSKTETQKRTKQESKAEESSKIPEKVLKGEFDGNVFIYGDQGFEIFYGSENSAKKYAETVASIKKSLGSDINVYDITVPTHSLFALPEQYKAEGSDETESIKTIYSKIGKNIKTIDVTDSLEKHKDEYIYFGTDNNWTALGAYYAYVDFCKAADVKSADIKKLPSGEIKNFTGSLWAATTTEENPKGNKTLAAHPDTVKYYKTDGYCTLLESGSNDPREVTMIAEFAEGSNAYSAFIWGNNPYMKIETELKTGRKLCIIKDSYGCAFAPFTAESFDEIFVVDPRYYDGNIIDYIKKNKYTDVLILNSIMTANTELRTEELKTIME